MQKRNFILIVIALLILTGGVLTYLYFNKPQTLPPEEEGTNFFSNFNPFSKNTPKPPQTTPPEDVSGYEPDEEIVITSKNLVRISSMPVSGYALFLKERYKEILPPPAEEEAVPVKKPEAPLTEFVPAIRYISRATGNIYQTFLDKIEERQFSNTLIPKIYESFFGNKAESVLMRYLKNDDRTIQTFIGNLPKEVLGQDRESNEIKGYFLPDNITDAIISPDGTKAFYLLNVGEGVTGTVATITADQKLSKKTAVFDSLFTEWISSWPNAKMITLTTKASFLVPGYMYKVDPDRRELSRIFGEVNGLTTLTSPDGKLVLYSDNTLALSVYEAETRESTLLGIRTLPEKCVWGKVSTVIYCAVPKVSSGFSYPDTWYQGEVSFSDEIWKTDITTGRTSYITDLVPAPGESIDGIKLSLNSEETLLFFINKKDSHLWELDLREE